MKRTSGGASSELHVLHLINGLGTGGAERSLAEMITPLEGLGIRSTVCYLEPRAEGVQADLEDRVDVHRITGRNGVQRVLSLRRLLAGLAPDLLHTTLFGATVLGRLATVGTGVPVLTSLVNTPYIQIRQADPNLGRAKLQVVRGIDRLTAPRTTHFHAITEAVRAEGVRSLGLPADRVTVVPRGRDARRLAGRDRSRQHSIRADLGLGGGPLVVAVGRQEYQKGHTHLLAAIPLIVEHHPDVVVAVAGRSGSATPALMAENQMLPPEHRIRFVGHREDVADLVEAADVFVFPSLFEGLGGSVLEALALGTPVVAFDIPALHEVLAGGEAGVLVPVGDSCALARQVVALLSDETRRTALAAQGLRRFHDSYTLEHSVRGMAQLYRRVVTEPRQGTG